MGQPELELTTLRDLFFYGSLRHLPLLRVVLGAPLEDIDIRDAILPGYAAHWVIDECFPVLVAHPGKEARGVLVCGLSDEMVARLDFYEGGFAYELQRLVVTTEQGNVTAEVYVSSPDAWPVGDPFSLTDWETQWGALSVDAAQEAMTYFGAIDADALASRFAMIRARAASRHLARESMPQDVAGRQVELEVQTVNHAGFYLLKTLQIRHEKYDGMMSDTLRREVFVSTDAVIVLPYDVARDRLLLVEQFRIGPFARSDRNPWTLEPVAGRIDFGETPQDAALRETREETGVSIARLEPIAAYYPSPGGSSEFLHQYLGLCDLPDGCAGGGGLASENEDIRSCLLDFDAAMTMLAEGRVNNGPLVCGLLWLSRERARLRASA